jgi:hypothetical protein
MNDKIRASHRSRKAVLYIRQSSPSQVLRNEESRRLQYGMKQRLLDLGWNEVEIVDEDLGKSAAGMTPRSGFERMVAQVCLGKVGGTRGVALCPQQQGLAATGGSLPYGRYAPGRSRQRV